MKRATIYISISLALGLGLLLVLLWLLGGEIGISMAAARAAEPARLAAPGDVYCVALEGGGPYPGCNQIFTSVQAAVDAASGGEVIKVSAGNYTGVQGRPAPPGYNGPSVITQVVYISKTVTIHGGYTITNWTTPYPITQPTTLDAQGQGRVLFIVGDISPTIAGLRITGGSSSGLGGGRDGSETGGGLYIISGTVTISDSQVFGNYSGEKGGGLSLFFGLVTLSGSTIYSNTADEYGGGVCLERSSTATLIDSTVISNTVSEEEDPEEGLGGGLWIDDSDATLIDSTISSNTAFEGSGGGLYLEGSSTVTLTGSTVSFNRASGNGGGLRVERPGTATLVGSAVVSNTGSGLNIEGGNITLTDSTVSFNTRRGLWIDGSDAALSGNTISHNTGGGVALFESSATLSGNTIAFNTGEDGGGLEVFFGSAMLSGNTIYSNTASRDGGGLFLFDINVTATNNVIADNRAEGAGSGLYVCEASAHLLHTTIARNVGGDGSGVYVSDDGGGTSTVAMTNTILVSHTVGVSVTAGHTATLEATLWGDGDWANGTNWGGDGTIVTGTVNIEGLPAFVDPDNWDYHIGPGSAAIDAGVDAGITTDIDGQSRPRDGVYDIGADELNYFVYLPLVLREYP